MVSETFFVYELLKLNTKTQYDIQENMPPIAKKDTGSSSSNYG